MFDFSSLPVIDNHSHPYEFTPDPARYKPLDTFVGVGYHEPGAVEHRDAMLYQRWAVRQIAGFLGCAATPDAVAAARAAVQDERTYRAHLFSSEQIEAIVADTGYPWPPVNVEAYAELTPVPVLRVFRIEPLIKQLLADRLDFDALAGQFDARIRKAIREDGFVAVKSIIAYRTGIDINPASEGDEAGRAGLDAALADLDRMTASKPLRDHLVMRTMRLCRELGVSFHVHTGFGDPEIVLAKCNPAMLNELLRLPGYRETKVVLIHCYPYLAEGSWMASALPNVWIDLSLGIPFAPAAAERILEMGLELAPINRLLFGTDAFSGPEQTWLGAKLAKQALARVLTSFHERDLIAESEAEEIATAYLSGNARALYGV